MALELLPHSFFALRDGSQLRYAQFAPSTKSLGTVLVLPGRREFIEKKYAELKPLQEKGYHLIIVELRGQGLSSRSLSGDKRQRDHIDNFTIHLDDLRAFYTSIVKPQLSEPLIIHGHSLGGHMALRWLAEDTLPVAGAFVTAPMLALFGVTAQLAVYGMSWVGGRLLDHSTHYAPTQHNYGEEDCVFANNPLTQDEERFGIIENYFKAQPDLTVGGVTWGWMLAALRSMNLLHNWHYLSRINIPVLALIGDHDRVTPASELTPYLNRIPRIRTRIVANSRHDILNEITSVRFDAWQHIYDFFDLIKTEA